MGYLDIDRRILALAFARMVDSLGNSFLIVVLPLYITSGVVSGGTFGLAPALITGIILSAFGFFNSAIQPFAGNLSDRTGKRRIFVIAGLLVLTVSNFVYTLVGGYGAVLLVRVAQGIGVALTVPATIALVNELASDTARGESMGVFNTFRMLGFGLGPVVAGGVVAGGVVAGGPYLGGAVTGFEAAFYVATISALLGAVCVYLLVEDPEVDDEADAGEEFSLAVFNHVRDDKLLDPVFTLGVASLFMAVGIALLEPLEHHINTTLGQSATMFGIEFSAFVLAQVVLQAPIGTWSDEYGRKPFIIAGLLLLVPTTLVQGFVTTPLAMIVARFLQGVAGAAVFAPAMALAGDIAKGRSSGTTLSVITMAFGLGTAVGPLSAGYLAGISLPFGTSYAAPFAFGAVLALLGCLLVYTQVDETVNTDGSSERADAEPAAAD
ncbi:transporter, major facilitator family [Halarchaeum acidiphilum MH1-52-1]|uniref:Transporter, major facilitator family n=1 Tax=Halarchaeum acidiphilum MH1-52-1 TaxID=1261545 RepID=U2YRM0_9EURY|nr:MFS transporter [Halarchaeum acidiphilum]GAD51645.1 transporter, major facilitator family [Halarchaeum acidiphilum MH1-52-1]